MDMSILNFRHKINNVARSSLFWIEMMAGPPALQGSWPGEVMAFTCKAASLPQDTFSKIAVPFFGREVGFHGKRQYQDWSTTINNTNNFELYRALWEWHRLMNDQKDNVSVTTNENDFKTDLLIMLNDATGTTNDKRTAAVKLCGVWPISVGEIQLDWESDQIASVQVTWSYDWSEMVNDINYIAS